MDDKHVIRLIPSQGDVFAPRAFVDRWAEVLSGDERCFFETAKAFLAGEDVIREPLRRPWLACAGTTEGPPECIVARKSGTRSACWPEQQVKFKGCRPAAGSPDFPFEWLPFGATEIANLRVPFGVMTAEGVLRELLGYAFCQSHGIPCATTPVCVYAYRAEASARQFCLVLRVQGDHRGESFLRLKGVPLSQVINPPQRNDGWVRGSEALLRGLNARWYSEEKGRWLAELHFHGGFRGLLNSNLGNDVIETRVGGTPRFSFCDFDSFQWIAIPGSPSHEFLSAFALQCVLEVVRGSLPIFEFVDVPSGSSSEQTARCVGDAYRRKSSLWNAYLRRARLKARELGWDWPALAAALDRVFQTQAFLQASCSVILSEYALRRYHHADRWDYVPHAAE